MKKIYCLTDKHIFTAVMSNVIFSQYVEREKQSLRYRKKLYVPHKSEITRPHQWHSSNAENWKTEGARQLNQKSRVRIPGKA